MTLALDASFVIGRAVLAVPMHEPSTLRTAGTTRISMRPRDDFDEFFLAHHASLLRTLTMITGDQELAADALQDAFQRAYVRWRKIRRYDAPESWVRRVAINRSRDLVRSQHRRDRREERVARPEAVVDDEPQLDLLHLLARLPERQRTALALHYLEGLSVEQVADEMSITAGAVKYHLHEGREKLRPLISSETRA